MAESFINKGFYGCLIRLRVPSSAPTSTLLGAFFVGADEGLTRFHWVRKMLAFSLSKAKAPFIRTKKERGKDTIVCTYSAFFIAF